MTTSPSNPCLEVPLDLYASVVCELDPDEGPIEEPKRWRNWWFAHQPIYIPSQDIVHTGWMYSIETYPSKEVAELTGTKRFTLCPYITYHGALPDGERPK